MGLFTNKYPYTDFHELNLDWIITKFKEMLDRLDALEAWKEEVDTWRDGIDAWQTTINNWKSSIDTWKSQISTTVQNIINGTQAIDISNNTSITNIEDDIADIISGETPVPSTYELPTATASRLGGIKVGSGLAVTADGTLRATGGGGGGDIEVTNTATGFVDVTLDDEAQSVVRVNYKFTEISNGLIYFYYRCIVPDVSGKAKGSATSSTIIPAWAIPLDNNVVTDLNHMASSPSVVTELLTNETAGFNIVSLNFVGAANYPKFVINKNAWTIPESGTPESFRTISGMLSYYTV